MRRPDFYSTPAQSPENERKEPSFVSDVPHDAKRARLLASPSNNSISSILRAKLRRSQRRHRDLRDLKAIRRIECVGGSVGDFLLTIGRRMDPIEADVLPEWSRASEEGIETEVTFGRYELGQRAIEIEVRPGVSRRLRRDVRVHLTNQIVDKRSVGRSENEIRGAW